MQKEKSGEVFLKRLPKRKLLLKPMLGRHQCGRLGISSSGSHLPTGGNETDGPVEHGQDKQWWVTGGQGAGSSEVKIRTAELKTDESCGLLRIKILLQDIKERVAERDRNHKKNNQIKAYIQIMAYSQHLA